MKIKHAFTGVIFSITAFQASAGIFGFGEPDGMQKNCIEKHSKAWCIWDASSVSEGVKDLEPKDFSGAFMTTGKSGGVEFATAALTTQDFMRSRFDPLNKGGSVAMLLLGAALHGKLPINNGNRVYAWMPLNMAKTPEEAGAIMDSILYESTKKSMKGRLVNEVLTNVVPEKNLYTWTVIGEECEQIECTLSSLTKQKFLNIYLHKGKKGKAPEWMGGYDAWVFDKDGGALVYELVENKTYASHRYMPNLSKNLPEWAFVSVCPETDYDGMKYNVGVPIPILFSKGKLLVPVFPDIQSTEFDSGEQK